MGEATSFSTHSSLLTKNRPESKDKTWGWAEEREVFGESQVSQEGSKNEESIIIRGNLLSGSQVY